ncbi:MAG: ester cyclase [Solirubrobacterales bacterium]|nr:ester cyclase [Solirubrobacterales bacterium]
MTGERNKQIVARFYEQAINDRDLEAVDRYLSEGFVHNGEPRGRAGQRAAIALFLDAFPDLGHTIAFSLAEDDLVAARQGWEGTHAGSFLGVAPTGKRVSFTSTAVLRIEAGQIAEVWDEADMLSVLAQVGALKLGGGSGGKA